jgi:hypothetical protein
VSFAVQRLERTRDRLEKETGGALGMPKGVMRSLVAKHAHEVLSFMKARARELGAEASSSEGKKRNSVANAEVVPEEAQEGKGDKVRRIVDKMLGNYRNLAHLLLLFPNATILHIARNPMDTLWSCHSHRFYDDSMVYTLNEKALVQEYLVYRSVMRHFAAVLPADRVVEVAYEELVCRPEATMRRVLGRMGLPWDEAVLRFYRTERVVHTHSVLQVKQPLYTKSIGAWQRYETQLAGMVNILQRLNISVSKYTSEKSVCSAFN